MLAVRYIGNMDCPISLDLLRSDDDDSTCSDAVMVDRECLLDRLVMEYEFPAIPNNLSLRRDRLMDLQFHVPLLDASDVGSVYSVVTSIADTFVQHYVGITKAAINRWRNPQMQTRHVMYWDEMLVLAVGSEYEICQLEIQCIRQLKTCPHFHTLCINRSPGRGHICESVANRAFFCSVGRNRDRGEPSGFLRPDATALCEYERFVLRNPEQRFALPFHKNEFRSFYELSQMRVVTPDRLGVMLDWTSIGNVAQCRQ